MEREVAVIIPEKGLLPGFGKAISAGIVSGECTPVELKSPLPSYALYFLPLDFSVFDFKGKRVAFYYLDLPEASSKLSKAIRAINSLGGSVADSHKIKMKRSLPFFPSTPEEGELERCSAFSERICRREFNLPVIKKSEKNRIRNYLKPV